VRRKKEEEHENSERWLVSYADFITLLFAFFTTLYAISTVDNQKMGKMVTSMRESFDSNLFPPGSRSLSITQGAGSNPSARAMLQSVDLAGINTKDTTAQRLQDIKMPGGAQRRTLSGDKALSQLKKEIETALKAEVSRGRLLMTVEPRGLVISLGEAGMYDSGSDQIKPEGKFLLDTIASSLSPLTNEVRVEGHTDNVPIHNSSFPSNWELSTARATGMLRYLVEKFGFVPDLLSAGGYAEYRPSAANDTEEGRTRNRRVDIVVLNPTSVRAGN
jgi:chemotaxis protein MotB